MSINISDLQNLPVSEKLRIVEALWDDIGASDEPIVLQPWQRDEAQRRSSEMKADPSIALIAPSFGGGSMSNSLRFHPLVADDLEAAADWYDALSCIFLLPLYAGDMQQVKMFGRFTGIRSYINPMLH